MARALNNRGVVKEMVSDLSGALADYTAVADLAAAPKEQVARALVNRGVAKGRVGDLPGALADFTAVVDLAGVPKKQLARALADRGFRRGSLGIRLAAQADWERVMMADEAEAEVWTTTGARLFELHWLAGSKEKAEQALELFNQRLGGRDESDRAGDIVRLLSRLAMPALKDAWHRAWRLLAKGQPTTVGEALEFLKPVALVLEGADVSSLNTLSPEQREFAQRILLRFEAEPGGPCEAERLSSLTLLRRRHQSTRAGYHMIETGCECSAARRRKKFNNPQSLRLVRVLSVHSESKTSGFSA